MQLKAFFPAAAALAAALLITAPAHAAVDAYFPHFVVPAFFGQANTTFQEWNGFTSATGANAPTVITNSAGAASASDSTAATDGAFLTGSHIYSFSAPTSPAITLANFNLGSSFVTTLILQVETTGSEIDLGSVKLTPQGGSPLVPTLTTLLHQDLTTTPFGESATDDYSFTWQVPGNAAGYTLNLTASGPSMSWIGARVDTLAAVPTPEPTSLGVLGAAFLLLRRRRIA